MNRRFFIGSLFGVPVAAAGLVLAVSPARALPVLSLDGASPALADALWRSTDAVQPEVEPALLLGRSLHRMRRQAARRRAQRRRR